MRTRDTKCVFLWDDQDQWSKITRIMVDQMNLWIHSGQGFIGSFDLPWSKWSQTADPDPDHPKGTQPKSRPQRVNSYKLNLFIADTAVIRWICIGWIPSILAGELCRMKSQSLHTKQRFAKGVRRNITDFLKASITTDSMKIFFHYILYSSHCLLHSGFVQVMENLESHGIYEFYFPGAGCSKPG